MLAPSYLKKGDRVVILSTARKISPEEIAFAVKTLEDWGLTVSIGKSIGQEDHQFAGSDAVRTEDFQQAVDDPTIKAIFCARGGYGTVRILDQIDFTRFLKSPKWIVGYSDITYLHTFIQVKLAIQTLHATMPINFKTNTAEALDSLRKALFGEPLSYEWASHPLNIPGSAEAQVVGGNLSILYSLTGTSSGFNSSNRILFMEDLDEYLYHIDRMMYNLDRSGKLANCKAVLVGGMTDMNDNSIPFGYTAEEIIHDVVKQYNVPLAFNGPFGHLDNNLALFLGRKSTLEIKEEKSSLTFN